MRLTRISRYAIMASGNGSNALSLIHAGIECGQPPCFVVCNNENSLLFEKVKEFGVPIHYINSTAKGVDEDFENRVLNLCSKSNIDWVFLAGFMKVLSPVFLKHFNVNGFNQIINIHPSLLPKYPGLGGYKKAYDNNDSEFGHTLHLVTNGVDEGPIIFQKVLVRENNLTLNGMIEIGKVEENKSYARLLTALIKNGYEWDGKELMVSWNYP